LLLIAGLGWIVGVGGLALFIVARHRTAAKAAAYAVAIVVTSLALFLAPLLHESTGVALPDELPLQVAPDHRAETIRIIQAGARLRIRERRGDWLRVMSSDTEGWVASRLVGEL
jgi:MFS superfamily sulfate permease-like transporter